MQSIASIMTADNSFDVGIVADIDSDDENHRAVDSVAESDSSFTAGELTSQIEEAFGHDSSAHGELHYFISLESLQNWLAKCNQKWSKDQH